MPGTTAQDGAGKSLASTIALPYDTDPLASIADSIINQYHDQLPNLANVVILLPETSLHADMRRNLLTAAKDKGVNALLGPHISSLPAWIEHTYHCDVKRISQHERELVLVEALKSHPDLPGAKQPWLLAENLLNLFDELNRYHVNPGDDLDSFKHELSKAYGINKHGIDIVVEHLDRESHLVHRLWHAWHEQLEAQNADDSLGIYHRKLQASIDDEQDNHVYWLAGYYDLSSMETAWYRNKSAKNKAHMFTQSAELNTSERSHFISQVFEDSNIAFAERARKMPTQYPASSITDNVRTIQADNEELEACAVELQVRQWLLDGINNVGIVTQDRRLARRIRALLERAGINLQDNAGWPLSTTSAAAAVERWLECIELDFDNLALRDLLRTSFVFREQQDDDYLKTVFRFEQDIVLHENIASGMYRYKRAIDSRETRLKDLWPAGILDSIRSLLDCLDAAAKPLASYNNNKTHHPAGFIDALINSMKSIGMYPALNADPAGQRILHELDNLKIASTRQGLELRWGEIRSWIGRAYERYSFIPDTRNNNVTLLNLKQAHLMTFDAVILAGADRSHLPQSPAHHAFFNDTVRYALGLPTNEANQQEQQVYFINLLCRNNSVLITSHSASSEGDTVLPSRWLEALSNFHTLAYNEDLTDTQLGDLLRHTHSGVINDARHDTPAQDSQPSPATPVNRLPAWFSASSYQQLVDCPYKFFASRLLGLHASEEISDVLSKTEYGELVHKCLEAFHSDIDYLPGPFTATITIDNRHDAEALLGEIAKQVFSRDINENFEHRGWLQRFTKLIPGYIEWQVSHAQNWNIKDTEETIEIRPEGFPVSLKGRLDRIDSNDEGLCIIDYKTGYTPSKQDVSDGEAVQLPFYAMLTDATVSHVEYLKLDAGTVKSTSALDSEQLQTLRDENQQRLNKLVDMLNGQHALPAWGDEGTCGYCDMLGLCRRDSWVTADKQ